MKKALALLLAVCLVLALTACGGSAAPAASNAPAASSSGSGNAAAPAAEGKDSVSVSVESVISTLDPYETLAYTSWFVFNQIYETLVTVDDNGNVQPCLATAWEVSEDGCTYTFTLETGVKFHDGSDFTAKDAAYSLTEAMKHPAMQGYTKAIESVEVVGDNQIACKLLKPSASFVSMMSEIPIVSEAFYSAQENNIDVGVGTGPYMLTDQKDLNREVVLTRFDGYRKGPAAIKDVHLKVVSDASTSVAAFETGDLDFLTVYNISSYAGLAANDKYNSALCATLHTAYTTMNLEKEPLDNKLLRQAMSYAIDYDSVIVINYEGLAKRAYALMGENSFGADFTDIVKYEYNPELAKQLLAEAGFPDGIDFADYGIEYDYIPGGYHEKIAQCVQQNWADVGIKINLRANDNIDSDAPDGNFSIGTEGGTYTADMSFMSIIYGTEGIGGNNYSRYSNPEVDELFAEADATTDQAVRLANYKKICEIVSEDACYIPIQHKQIPYVWYSDLNAVVHLSSAHPWYCYEWSWNA